MPPPAIADSEWIVTEAFWAQAPQTASELTKRHRERAPVRISGEKRALHRNLLGDRKAA